MPSAVIVPASPALVPAVAGRTPELEDARTAARDAVRRLLVPSPQRVVVVADAKRGADGSSQIDLSGYGLPGPTGGGSSLPVAFASAAWLLDDAEWAGERTYVRPIPQRLADDDAVLVVADGTACRSERAPGHFDPRAEAVDDQLTSALAAGDLSVLDEIGRDLAGELMIGGLPALAWLRDAAAGRSVSADLAYSGAPLGVGVWVARWTWSVRAR